MANNWKHAHTYISIHVTHSCLLVREQNGSRKRTKNGIQWQLYLKVGKGWGANPGSFKFLLIFSLLNCWATAAPFIYRFTMSSLSPFQPNNICSNTLIKFHVPTYVHMLNHFSFVLFVIYFICKELIQVRAIRRLVFMLTFLTELGR
jgi:hypothetical protein